MKALISILAFLPISACVFNVDESSKNVAKQSQSHSHALLSTFKTILNGEWVEMGYIEDLRETNSPYKSQDVLKSIVELSVDTLKINGDSLEIGSPGIHEGGSFFVYFRPGVGPNSFPTNLIDYDNESNFYELGFLISEKDTIVAIYHYDRNRKLMDQNAYMKVPEKSEGALPCMVNEVLIEGKYTLKDTVGNTSDVQFTRDGRVSGLSGFSKFFIITDFVASPESNIDEICFDIQTENQVCYAFEKWGDTIKLYESLVNEEGQSTKRGLLIYELVRL